MINPRHVLRTQIFADDQWHTIDFRGPIVHVATRSESYVEVWFIDDSEMKPAPRTVRVFGTGHQLAPEAGEHIGSAITPSGRLVWHLFEMRKP